MSHGPHKIDEKRRREPFNSGWTGRITVALFVYVAAAIPLTFIDAEGSRAYEIFTLYSDAPASIIAAILAGAAALVCYSVGNLMHATYWLFGVDPIPSIGDVLYLAFYPLVFAAVLTVVRAAASSHDPDMLRHMLAQSYIAMNCIVLLACDVVNTRPLKELRRLLRP